MLVLLNSLLVTCGVAGVAWYIFSISEFRPLLGYFITLCTVGSVTAVALCIRSYSFRLLAVGLNGVSVVLLVSLLIVAFLISPGSGVAAFPFVVVPLVVNLASMKGVRTEIKG